MLRLAKPILFGAALMACVAAPASAADFYEPPVVEAPPPVYYQPEPEPAFGGWYIRGDVDYHLLGFRGGDWITYGCCGVPDPGTNSFSSGTLRGALSLGAGAGYQVNKYFRVDLTGDYFFNSAFRGTSEGGCGGVATSCTDETNFSALVLMANAYAELGTWKRITPYVGAGIGGARVNWGDLTNTTAGIPVPSIHAGATSWRFAWALMAGASYCINKNWKVDVGYRFMRINGGRMFELNSPAGVSQGAGPGFDRGINVHEGRAGLRYQFGGGSDCGPKKEYVSYEPEPIVPVYK